MSSNTRRFASTELYSLKKIDPENPLLEYRQQILEICEIFGNSGQSGGSAPYTAKLIASNLEKLLLQEVISPVTGDESEWVEVSDNFYQNSRCSALFKEGEDGEPWYAEAIVFDGDIGGRFTGANSVKNPETGDSVSSHQYVRSFPFTPKTFYIDVKDFRWKDRDETISDPDGDWWSHELVDPGQLKEVFEYYKK